MESNSYKEDIIEGFRVGLVAFLICFFVVIIGAALINYFFIDDINRVLNGSLSAKPKPNIGSLLLIVSLIMNLSVFNSGGMLDNGGSLHIGLLIFIALPSIAFMIADRRDNKKEHFNLEDMLIYGTSSIVYGLLLYLFSLIAKGSLLGLEMNFTKPLNLLTTIIIVLSIQFFIGLNYNKDFSPGIKMTRVLLRVFLGFGLIAGGIGMIFVLMKYLGSVGVSLMATILLLPNIATYIMFTFMGASIEFGNQLQVLMNKFGVDISFATLPLIIRIGFIMFFFIIVFVSIWRLKSERFLEEVILFATSFSLISLILAYMTKINLGFVKNLLDVQFGIDYFFAFTIPFVIIILAGFCVLLIRFLKKEIKS